MTTHVATFEILAAREAAAPAHHPQQTWSVQQTLTLSALIGGGIVSSDLSPGVIPVSAWNPIGSVPCRHVFGRVATDVPSFAALEAMARGVFWSINGVYTDNSALLAIGINPLIANGRQSPPLRLVFDGAAETALVTLVGEGEFVDVQVETHWCYPAPFTYMGLLHFGEFQDQPPDSTATAATRVSQLLRSLESASARAFLGTTSAGQDLFANSCNFTGLAPEGQVIITPADIGNQAEQIPQNVGANTAAHFRFHPSVFVRRSDYFRDVTRQAIDTVSIDAIQQGSQPLAITQVVQALVASDWLVVVDGTPYLCRLIHPQGTDFRRPRDIWNNIWVPIITGSQSAPAGTLFRGFDGLGQVGPVQIADRFTYLEYARMIGFGDQFAIQRVPQDDTDLI